MTRQTIYRGPVFEMARRQFDGVADLLNLSFDERDRLLYPKRAMAVTSGRGQRRPRDDARMDLCGAGFAFSRSGDLCHFSGFRRNQSRVGGRCGGSVTA